MKTGKHSVVIGNVPSNSDIGEGSVVIGATDTNGNTIINQPMAAGFGAKADSKSIAIGAFAGAGIHDPVFPECIKNEMAELLDLAAQQQNHELLAAIQKLSDELKPDKPNMSLVHKAWQGVEALGTFDGASNLVTSASTSLRTYFSQIVS